MRNYRRFLASFMVFLMVFGTLPLYMLTGNEVKAAENNGDTVQMVFNASEMQEGDITSEFVVGDFVLKASDDKKLTVDSNNKSNEDGSISFAKRLKTNGKSGDAERTITFKTEGAGTATVYMISSNKDEADRALSLHDDATGKMLDGASFYAPVSAGDDGKITPVVYNIPSGGTYRFMASQGINIYYIVVEYQGGTSVSTNRKDWSEVSNPDINSIEINNEGKIEVSVSVELGTDGADSARVLLYQNGYEVASESVTESGVYTFAPTVKGDFSAKVIALRRGCLDKESETVKITGYKLPMPVPEITWTDNLGDGEVYVNWADIGADSYVLSVKEEGDKAFKVVEDDLTYEDYTLTELTPGKTYDIKVVATQEGRSTEDIKQITVGEPKQQWYIASMGSATSGVMSVGGQEYEVKTTSGLIPVDDVTNTNKTVTITAQSNGKIADSEDGIFYYFTKINPNTENFVLSATYTVTDVSAGPDNQTGYGIYATDITGVGTKDAKYFNSVSVGQFKLQGNGYHGHGARLISGYISYDAYNNEGAVRNHDNRNSFSVKNENDSVNVGDKFTYTLEKTDDQYIASMTGADGTIVFDGTDSLMQQDDGSVCVGVASARKVTVEISDIKFEKSEGAVDSTSVVLKDPKLSIYSGDSAASTEYEAIACANSAGKLNIKDSAGTEIYSGTVDAFQIVRAVTTLKTTGTTDIVYEFTPDKNEENLSSYDMITVNKAINFRGITSNNGYIYVAPQGTPDGNGTPDKPFDVQTALNYVAPGTTIVMLDGTYLPASEYIIGRSICGTESAPITLVAQNPGSVTIDGSNLAKNESVINLVGSYWHIYGLDICNGPSKGIAIAGNNNTVEMCKLHNNGTAGIQISRYSDEPNDERMWPSDNLVKNCDAYDNCDEGRTDADGFAAKLTCGTGNKFYGCIAYNNIDDGWDLYAKSTTGPIGEVVIENCVSYSNGFVSTDDLNNPDVRYGEGNGFKLGGENMFGAHQLINSIAFNNYNKGITSNSGPNCEVINCTSYNNSLDGISYNISMYTKNSNPKAWIVTGMLSVSDNGKCSAELGASNGVIYSLRSANNYFYDGVDSSNNQGNTASTDWFENTDVTVHPSRNADGTIDMHGLLVLNDKAPSDTGARIDSTTKNALSVCPTLPQIAQTAADDDVEVIASGLPVVVWVIVIIVSILLIAFLIFWKKLHG